VPRFAVVLVLPLLIGACGKIGTPQPPFVRIPERIRDLTATQTGYEVTLSWTNPAHNIDGSTATELAKVHITSNGAPLLEVTPTGAGKPQLLAQNVQSWLGETRTYRVWLETSKHKVSDPVETSIHPVDIPGPVTQVTPLADQYAIKLTWDPPAKNPDLASGYFVRRTDRQEPPPLIHEREYADNTVQRDRVYTYEIVAAREVDSKWITGIAAPPVTVKNTDTTPPKTPTGLQLVVSDGVAILTWDPNQELDLKGYFIYRDGYCLNPDLPHVGNSFVDMDYQTNSLYTVSAIDEFGNRSPQSKPVSGLIR